MLEADRQPGPVADRAQPGQHAGRERHPVQRVVADRERLPRPRRARPPGGRPGRGPAAPCTRMPSTSAPRAPSSAGAWWRRAPAAARPRGGRRRSARRYAARCRTARPPCPGGAARPPRPTRRTARPRRRTASSAPRRSRSSGATSTPTLGRVGQPAARRWPAGSSSKPVVPTTAWMPWSMQNSRLSMTASGWVKSTTACAPASTRASSSSPTSSGRDQLEVVGGLDRAAHLGADLAPRASTPTRRTAVTRTNLPAGDALTCARARLAGWSHGGADDPGPDPVGRGLHGRPADDHVLEIGCGPGAGAELICARLETGKLFAIDRSESGVDRTKRRCAQVHRGRPAHRAPDRPGHAAGAGQAADQGVRVQRQPVLGARLRRRGGAAARAGAAGRLGLPLLRRRPRPSRCPTIVEKASAALQQAGFRVSVVEQKAPAVRRHHRPR